MAAPKFSRQYLSVCDQDFPKTDVRTRQGTVRKLSLMPNKSREYRVGTPCEGAENQLVGKFLEFLKPFFKKVLSGCGQSPRPFAPLTRPPGVGRAHDLSSAPKKRAQSGEEWDGGVEDGGEERGMVRGT